MKILGISDIVTKDMIAEAFAKYFPGDDLRIIELDLVDSMAELQEVNRKIEREGLDSFGCTPFISDAIKDFQPEIIAAHFAPITKECLENSDRIEVIGLMRAGYENVELEAANDKGIKVIHTPGRNANAVAEFTLGLIFSEIKNISRGHRAMKRGEWRRRYPFGDLALELEGRTLGIIGFGNIGRLIAEKLSGFDLQILGYDPYVKKEIMEDYGVKKRKLPDLLMASDIVTLHARLNEDTRNLIGKSELELMKSRSFLINAARAGLVNKDALYQALLNKEIAGAALDVFWQEPIDINNPFTNLDNVTLTPHYAGFSEEALEKSPLLLAEALRNYYDNRDTTYVVN